MSNCGFRAANRGGLRILAALSLMCSALTVAVPVQAEGVHEHKWDAQERLIKRLERGSRRIAFEVVEFGTRFAFQQEPLDDAGFPTYGNPFITQGVIYPSGTLTRFEDGSTNGVIVDVDADGNAIARAEFPNKVLGVWICRGTVFGADGFNIATGPVVATTQLYDFNAVGGEFGRISFASEGLELIDVDETIRRAVTGGTGPYRRVRAEIKQTFRGLNASEGFTLSFELN